MNKKKEAEKKIEQSHREQVNNCHNAILSSNAQCISQSKEVTASQKETVKTMKQFKVVCNDKSYSEKGMDRNHTITSGPDSNGTTSQDKLDVIDGGVADKFARLVRGWETYLNHGARTVQREIPNLGSCQENRPPQLQEAHDDKFKKLSSPFVLRHTHSSPLNYSTRLDDEEEEEILPPQRLERMKRSSSTPSAFGMRSAGSAFGTTLRTMPNLTGHDDRSAFSLPIQRSFHPSRCDSSELPHFSAFDPISFPSDTNDIEKTSIEVTDMSNSHEQKTRESSQKWHRASRAKKFLTDNVRVLRRRSRRSGRENPARPSSTTSSITSNKSSYRKRKECGKLLSNKHVGKGSDIDSTSVVREVSIEVNVEEGNDIKDTLIQKENSFSFSADGEIDNNVESSLPTNIPGSDVHFQGLHSNTDKEEFIFEKIESIHDSIIDLPSRLQKQLSGQGQVGISSNRSKVFRHGERVRHSSPHSFQITNIDSTQSPYVGRSLSLDSRADSSCTAMSAITLNTTGHSTIASNTSATVNSDKLTTLSVVSETDREVMETNKAGRDLRLQVSQGRNNSNATIHSTSTGSTATHGYHSLVGSPSIPREGACMPTDRFFKVSQVGVIHSVSGNSESSSSSDSVEGTAVLDIESTTIQRVDSQLTNSTIHPFGATGSFGNTTSTSSTQSEEPPVFVAYLDRQSSIDMNKVIPRSRNRSSPPYMISTVQEEFTGEPNSPAQILGYPQVIFEAAKPGSSRRLIRQVNKLQPDRRFSERPPLSPIKGLRTPTTPPPFGQRSENSSPALSQSSPPNIVNHRMQNSHLSKPYVLRSAPNRKGMTLITPDRKNITNHVNSRFASGDAVYVDSCSVARSQTYRETNFEVENTEFVSKMASVKIVTPEKGPDESVITK